MIAETIRRARRLLSAVVLAAICNLLSGAWIVAVSAERPDAPAMENVVPLVVGIPHSGFNRMLISVTVCVPGTHRCATIRDVMVDTGSTGLRLEASAMPPRLQLPRFIGQAGRPLAECLHFVHDVAWGPLYHADLRIGGMVASNLPIQVIADDGRLQPDACPPSDVRPTSNGTLGIGPQRFDCRDPCENDAKSPGVFVEQGGTWKPVHGLVAPSDRLPNPVSFYAGHDNGIVIDLPEGPAGGAATLKGTLTFGIEATRGGRTIPTHVVPLDKEGRFTTRYKGVVYPESYIDSGTETDIVGDAGVRLCEGLSWAYCVRPAQTALAFMVGATGDVPVPFTIGDYRAIRRRRLGASDGLVTAGERSSKAFVWGAPFFFGKRTSVVLEGKTIEIDARWTGPLYAWRSHG